MQAKRMSIGSNSSTIKCGFSAQNYIYKMPRGLVLKTL